MNKPLVIILVLFVVTILLGVGGLAVILLHPAAPAATGGHSVSGSSVAVWTAVAVAVYIPLIAGAAKRRRDKKNREDK